MVTLLLLLHGCDGGKPGGRDTRSPPSDTASDTDTAHDSARDTGPIDADADGFLRPLDCNDADARVYPGAPDGCDALDQDCDGVAQPEGSCGEMVDMAAGAAGWWAGTRRRSELALLDASTDYTEDGIVDPLAWLSCDELRGCGGTMALLPGRIPGEDEAWNAVGGPSWTGEWESEYLYVARGAGDFDGDGSQDLFATTAGCYPDVGSLYVMLGPSERWGSGGRYLLDGADGWWLQHQPDDCFGVSAAGGYDIDGDGRDDLLIETRGIAGSPDFEGAALSFVAGRSAPLPMGASMNDEVWFADDVSLATYALLPDMDGDGAGEAAAVLAGADASHRTFAYFSADVLASGSAGSSLNAELESVPVLEWPGGYWLLAGRSGVGDVNGDGLEDVAIGVVKDVSSDGAYEYCVAHLLGASDMRTTTLEDRFGGLACFEAAEADAYGLWSRVAGDLDADGIADVVYGSPAVVEDSAAACIIPSSRHPAAGWALADEVRPYCFGSTDEDAGFGGLADLDGDGLPEILGTEVWWTDPNTPEEEMAGRILVMQGFKVPWDDDSRW